MNAPDPLQTSFAEDLPDPTQSVDLLAQAQNGDQQALSALLDRYQARLHRIVRVRLGARLRTRVESMDIVQDAYAVAMRKIGDLEVRGPGSILNWLARIAEHKIHDANDYFGAEKRDLGREKALDASGSASGAFGLRDRFAASADAPDEEASRSELREIIDDALTELSDVHREVILLRDYCGGDWDYVARTLGRGNTHAAQELHRRAWIKLRRAVRPRLGDRSPD